MKNIALLLLFVAGSVINANAQPPGYDDLVIYFADGDYEKLLKTAEKYTQKDDTKKDAIPYLYLAKCNFEMSKDQKWLERYPKAYNDAIRYAGNCIKKDRENVVVPENRGFFVELKVAVVEDIKNLVDEESYMKLMGYIAKLHRFDKEDVGSYFLKAGAQYMEKDKSGGKLSQKEAWERLEAIQSVDDWTSIDFEMLRIGVILYCDAQINVMRQPQAAKDLLGRVKQWLEKDPIFMSYYDNVVN
jgi:tetratricopeptide (TPR) repeat protein